MSQRTSRPPRIHPTRGDSPIERSRGGRRAAWLTAAGIVWSPALAMAAQLDPADEQRLEQFEKNIEALRDDVTDIGTEQQKTASRGTGAEVATEGVFRVQTDDGQFSFRPIGRIQIDAAFYDEDKSKLGDGAQVRRARLGMRGKLFYDWLYKFEMEFSPAAAAGSPSIKDAYVSYAGWSPAQFTVGNFYEPFGLEGITAETFITFLERALPVTSTTSSFAPDRRVGVGASHYDSNWSASIGTFMKNADDTAPADEGDQQFDVSARVTFDPILDRTHLLHFGLSGRYSNPNASTVSFNLKPESNVTAAKFLNTGTITNVDHLIEVDPEMAVICGPASIQGEYFWVPISRTHPNATANSPSVTLTGWYTQASYFLTGESRNYNPTTARFDRIAPFQSLGRDGGWGAFELAARVSHADYEDGPQFQFGKETNYTLGLNWYANPYIRFMLNYIWVRNDQFATGNKANLLPGFTGDGGDNPQILEFRAQVDW